MNEELIRKIKLILIETGQNDKKFRLGEIIKYSPSEVANILRKHKDAEIPHEPHIPFETLQNACKYRRTYHEIEGYFKKRDVCYNKKNAAECNSECPLLKSYEEVDA